MQSCFKIDFVLIKLSNVEFLCLKASVFPNPLVLYKRLTLSAASIFVTEGLFIYIYFLLLEENHQNRNFRAGEKISPTISLFFS